MDTQHPLLPNGYSTVPAGKIANVETHLEMLAKPSLKSLQRADASLSLERWQSPGTDEYRSLFRAVGEEWMWTSRLVMADDKLAAILSDPLVEIYRLMDGDRPAGLLELDFHTSGECELAFFGLVSSTIGKGAGRFMMNRAIDRAWSQQIQRFWVHTCTHDSQGALSFYCRSGFTPFAIKVEVTDDPRITGVIRRDAAPHVPLIEV
ncbi:GNAT family N-acetyltransferase [Neorhizobium lilium]|uniref:GNAT family N-acetyltransferase n=1 Tax=Neorhizobium lilium TaxID=2503024 RepID=A0A3S3SEI3_9HYPH|nr:GNAT family N-acetyltransferase [Neorhizobium lilium]RWX78332.1 GNAT family N-acetyltransferase [Neorhizobium lilium]